MHVAIGYAMRVVVVEHLVEGITVGSVQVVTLFKQRGSSRARITKNVI